MSRVEDALAPSRATAWSRLAQHALELQTQVAASMEATRRDQRRGPARPRKVGVGGVSDASPCSDDTDCPGGFCHAGDCRVDPLDTDSTQEGVCTLSPTDRFCVATPIKGCLSDTDCQPSAACPFCTPGDTCQIRPRACFVNSGIIRTGSPGTPDRDTAAIYCVPGNGGAIDTSAGFPGPGALIQHESVIVVP